MKLISLIFVVFAFASCQEGEAQAPNGQKDLIAASVQEMPTIDKTMYLPKYLVEISGLSYDASANVLIGHDDELGILYFIDFEKGAIDSKLKIGDIGDYEGVELVGDKIYLINSAGGILEHEIGKDGARKIKTGLNATNNVEGLAYLNDQLLIACKGKAEMNSSQTFAQARAIYSYSLKTSSMDEQPFMLMDYKKLRSFFKGSLSRANEKRLEAFAPSGIAIHPETGDIYILSFKGGLMLVCDAASTIKDIYFLDEEDHRQPEGICFDEENRLYIANEGRKSRPVIHRYQF